MSAEEETAVQALLDALERFVDEAESAGLVYTASGINDAIINVKALLSD